MHASFKMISLLPPHLSHSFHAHTLSVPSALPLYNGCLHSLILSLSTVTFSCLDGVQEYLAFSVAGDSLLFCTSHCTPRCHIVLCIPPSTMGPASLLLRCPLAPHRWPRILRTSPTTATCLGRQACCRPGRITPAHTVAAGLHHLIDSSWTCLSLDCPGMGGSDRHSLHTHTCHSLSRCCEHYHCWYTRG